MPSNDQKPLILVAGGTGRTGSSIVTGLLKRNTFRVAIITRPSSEPKPAVLALKERGVEIREADIGKDDLGPLLKGVDVLISAVSFEAFDAQRRLFDAAAAQTIPPRVVPCDFGTYTPPGVRQLADEKYEIRAYVESLGLPHTYIDVGWWMPAVLPLPGATPPGFFTTFSREFVGDGDRKIALTHLPHIGDYVARIVEDPRTLNKYVFVWEAEVTHREAWDIAKQVTGEDFDALMVKVSPEELLKRAAEHKENFKQTGNFMHKGLMAATEYQYSIYHRGDNTVANAKAAGALDAGELYPDAPAITVEEVAKETYGAAQSEWSL